MAIKIRRAEYFNASVRDEPGEAYRILSHLASASINLLAFSSIPMGPDQTQLVLFPEHGDRLVSFASRAGMGMNGPHNALMVQGDDEIGALVEVHRQLSEAGINVFASHGVIDQHGGYGYILYVRPERFEQAAQLLGV